MGRELLRFASSSPPALGRSYLRHAASRHPSASRLRAGNEISFLTTRGIFSYHQLMNEFELAVSEFLRLAHLGSLESDLVKCSTSSVIPEQFRGVFVGYNWSDEPDARFKEKLRKRHELILSHPNMTWSIQLRYFLDRSGLPRLVELISGHLREEDEEEIIRWVQNELDLVPVSE